MDNRYETVWLTQAQMAKLFGQTKQNVSLHINNCFREGELDEISVDKDSLTTAREGKNTRLSYHEEDFEAIRLSARYAETGDRNGIEKSGNDCVMWH